MKGIFIDLETAKKIAQYEKIKKSKLEKIKSFFKKIYKRKKENNVN